MLGLGLLLHKNLVLGQVSYRSFELEQVRESCRSFEQEQGSCKSFERVRVSCRCWGLLLELGLAQQRRHRRTQLGRLLLQVQETHNWQELVQVQALGCHIRQEQLAQQRSC